MRIMDYETNRSLSDIGVYLTLDEAAELSAYLQVLQTRPEIQRVHLSEILGSQLQREITVGIDERVSLA